MTRSVFAPATAETLRTVGDFNEECRPNMMFAGVFVNAECAKLGYLLSRRVSRWSDRRHYTFFGNSTLEALSGAIKLARHTSVRRHRDDDGWTLFVDDASTFEPFFDPTGAGPEHALVRHIEFVRSHEEAFARLVARRWSSVVLVRDDERGATSLDAALLHTAHAEGAMAILCDSELTLSDQPAFTIDAPVDVYVFGENLTDHQLPLGCLTMSTDAYSVWHNPRDSSAHTSTFGGNGLCLAHALETLTRHGYVDEADSDVFADIDENMSARLHYYRAHVNPHIAVGMEAFGLAIDVRSASGSQLKFGDGRAIVDCSGGTGASLHGHNPDDLVAEVLKPHESDHDYFADLEGLLTGLTRLTHTFPAVSGATTVDTALTLGILANKPRTKILTFKGNFSGKSLISMNFSRYSPESFETDRLAFGPYYFDLVQIDPFRRDSVAQFDAAVADDDVAVVWFEMVQGMECRRLPEPLLRRVAALKARHGYLIGVDEVLTGIWRAEDRLLAHEALIENSDLTVLAKPLSDMTTPMGVALLTNDVLVRATAANPEHVGRLRDYYRNGLSAHIAHHGLVTVSTPHYHEQRRRMQIAFRAELEEIARSSRLFARVVGTGTHLRLALKDHQFPFRRRSQFGQVVELAISSLILERADVLVTQLRFFPGTFASEDEFHDALVRLRAATRDFTTLMVYRHAATSLGQLTLSRMRSRRKRHATRSTSEAAPADLRPRAGVTQ